MGSDGPEVNPLDGEGPVRPVTLSPFGIAATAVTNAMWSAFAKATGYRTDAERYGWSYVFHLLVTPEGDRRATATMSGAPWWLNVPDANWRCPEGPGSTVATRANHPVVHISWNDALAYCAWSGTRLPTEAEWEFAARGGLTGARYPWGDELTPKGQHRANIWQGRFPHVNTADDGHVGTAPVRAYRPNGYGLYQMVGNIWEWCSDAWAPGAGRLLRGGSYLCHDSYCNRYRVSARTHNTADSSSGHVGFRVAL